ncbi:phage protein Gp36 family protein [Campylobacter sp. 9BO]|uniref:phage protein Gp36 family protein n=1 Tax=Campylobacter sp. 9BO TaxID=3424759 RepID=UPI003D34F180
MINNDDLLKEVSFKELTELSDFEGSGAINQGVIDDSLADVLAFIGSFVSVPANPTPLLKDIAVNLTIIELKRRNNFPRDSLKEQMQKYENLLLKMAAKKIPTELKDGKDEPKICVRAFKHSGERMDLKDING